MSDTCGRCATPFTYREYPRPLRTKRDKTRMEESGMRIEGKMVWLSRLFCDCLWRCHLKGMKREHLDLLLPSHVVEREIRRREGLERHVRAA